MYLDRDTTDTDVFDAPDYSGELTEEEVLHKLGIDPKTRAAALRAAGYTLPAYELVEH